MAFLYLYAAAPMGHHYNTPLWGSKLFKAGIASNSRHFAAIRGTCCERYALHQCLPEARLWQLPEGLTKQQVKEAEHRLHTRMMNQGCDRPVVRGPTGLLAYELFTLPQGSTVQDLYDLVDTIIADLLSCYPTE